MLWLGNPVTRLGIDPVTRFQKSKNLTRKVTRLTKISDPVTRFEFSAKIRDPVTRLKNLTWLTRWPGSIAERNRNQEQSDVGVAGHADLWIVRGRIESKAFGVTPLNSLYP